MIKTYEGQQVHNSLIDALVEQEIGRRESMLLEEARAALTAAEKDRDLMQLVYNAYWLDEITDARLAYSENRQPGPVARVALIALAYIALGWERLTRALGI